MVLCVHLEFLFSLFFFLCVIYLAPHSLAEQSVPESKVIVTTLSFFSFLPLLPSTSSQSPPPRCRPHTIPNSFIRPSVGDADKKEPRYWASLLFIDDVGITDREASSGTAPRGTAPDGLKGEKRRRDQKFFFWPRQTGESVMK